MRDAHNWMRYATLGLLLGAGLGAAQAASDDAKQAQDADKAQALAERRQKMIEYCVRNRGSKEDCEKQADTELAAQENDRQHSQDGGGRRGGR